MTEKDKLLSAFTSLILIAGITFGIGSFSTTARAQWTGDGDGICSKYHRTTNSCWGNELNCMCPIIITPEQFE